MSKPTEVPVGITVQEERKGGQYLYDKNGKLISQTCTKGPVLWGHDEDGRPNLEALDGRPETQPDAQPDPAADLDDAVPQEGTSEDRGM